MLLLHLLSLPSDLFGNLAGPVLIPAITALVMWGITKVHEFEAKLTGYAATAVPIVIATIVGAIGHSQGWDVTGPSAFGGSFVAWLALHLGIRVPVAKQRKLRS
jgi:hypothetical protein